MHNDFQDWSPVVLKKSGQNVKNNSNSNTKTIKIEKIEKEEKIPDKYNHAFIQEAIAKRLELNMKQVDLAKKLGVQLQTVQWFEQGREIYSGSFVDKLKRVLGRFTNTAKQTSN